MKRHRIVTIACALLACAAGEAGAQSPAPSARSFALANSYMARARGYEAPFWNPANLGLPDRPSFSIGLPGASVYLNNNSLSYGQIADLYGEYIDDATKSELLADIRQDDPDRMFELSFDVGAHAVAASIGRFAFGVGAVGAGNLEVSPDALELLLFGNVGEDGTGGDFSLERSHAQAWAMSTAFASYAQPFNIPALDWLNTQFAVGATVRYGVAHGFVQLNDRGSLLTSDPLVLDAEADVMNSTDADAGRVWSVDLGAAMDYDSLLTLGVSLQNAFANISWNEEEFELTSYSITADFDSTTLTDTTRTFSELAPDEQQRIVETLKEADVPKRLRLAAAYRLSPNLNVSADYTELIGGTLRASWDRTFAVGGELRLIPALPLRAGLATDFSQLAYTGGLGIYIGPVHTDFAIGRWGVAGGDGLVTALSISVWGTGSGY
ncbi:MAG: hypothetical protein AMS25_04535 [Gemmatimonas sp. SM23_52]|nr:MAG: hypothetical protein AMS25_04535 [Gemmatimonas sp. SM23_52]